jgi:hypothetical protein
MKITRKNLNKLIEAFIAGPDGRVRKLTGDPFSGEDYEHSHADDFIQSVSSQIDEPGVKNMLDNIYTEDDIESKQQAIDLAGSLSGASDEDIDDALFDLDTAVNPSFEGIKDDAYRYGLDKGLLKTFLNYLYRKGELYEGSMSIGDIQNRFYEMYPRFTGPTRIDLLNVGIDSHRSGMVSKVEPEKFKL